MALFSECMPWCARKGLDTADIVRDAIFRQLTSASPFQHRAEKSRSPSRDSCSFGPQELALLMPSHRTVMPVTAGIAEPA